MQMANVFSYSLLRFVVRGFSERHPLLAICLGLLLSQGCAMLKSPSETAVPTETTTQPAPSPPAPAQRRIKKAPLWKQNYHKPGKRRGMGRNIKENRRPAEQLLIKRGLPPHIQACHSVAE